MTPKKRNRTDLTTRNSVAQRKRDAKFDARLKRLEQVRVKKLEHYVAVLMKARRLAYYVSGDN